MTAALACARLPLSPLHDHFTAALPAIRARAGSVVRRVRCPHDRADAVLAAWRGRRRRQTRMRIAFLLNSRPSLRPGNSGPVGRSATSRRDNSSMSGHR
jgi:hypothetical protein